MLNKSTNMELSLGHLTRIKNNFVENYIFLSRRTKLKKTTTLTNKQLFLSKIYILVFGFLTAFLVVIFAMPSLIKVAKLKNLVDSPTEDRKMHRWSIPTLGSVVIFGAIVFSYTLWFPVEYDFINGAIVNFKFLIASLILLFFVGVKDDIIGTAPIKKLIAHIIVAFILVVMANLKN